MNITDALFLIGFWGIWITLAYWIFLSLGAIRYQVSATREFARMGTFAGPYPFVSVLVPAHDEALVIEATVRALGRQDYPREAFEIIVVNDASTDETGAIVNRLCAEYGNLKLHDIPQGEGGLGKSRTLNVGLRVAKGELVSVFDADNTPEPNCLRVLVAVLQENPDLVAVNAKVRTRNRDASWLTRFINLEFIYFQWLFQGGRWQWFGLSMLMGTGYVIYREALDMLGGFDEKSLVDDTEMSLRIFRGRRRIRWVPFATTWEQEPHTFRVWFRQRTRWATGNLYTTWKYLPAAFVYPYPLGLEIFSFILSFVVFIPALLASDAVLLLGLLGVSGMHLPGPYNLLWGLSLVVYLFHMGFAIRAEDDRPSNYFYSLLGYFTYAQFFIPVLLNALRHLIMQSLLRRRLHWDKTARQKEMES